MKDTKRNADADGAPKNSSVSSRVRIQARRLQIIDDETNRLREAAAERARSVDAKSSFLAVTAGVILTAAFTRTDIAAVGYWWKLLPVILAVCAIAAAALALRPASRIELTPDRLYLKWADSEQSIAAMERDILVQKINTYQAREKDITFRARVAATGFVLLILSSIALLVSYM